MENEEFSWESKGSVGSWDRLGENSKGELVINDHYNGQWNTFAPHGTNINTIEGNERRYIMRFMVIIIDWSSSTLLNDATQPLERYLIPFLKTFFLQNPLGQVALYSMKNSLCIPILPLSPSSCGGAGGGGASAHIKALQEFQKSIEPFGKFSLENALSTSRNLLTNLPNWASREVLLFTSTLSISDPSPNWFFTEKKDSLINLVKMDEIQVNVINLRGSLNILRMLTVITGGREFYSEQSLPSFLVPPKVPRKGGANFGSLIPMLFPPRNQYGYSCPRCLTLTDTLPSQCVCCASTLADATHIARSFHFLFPPTPLIKHRLINVKCSICMKKTTKVGECKKCHSLFCEDCEDFRGRIHQCPICL